MANVEFAPSGLRVYKQADQTVILAENQDLKDLQIFNLQGQLLLNQKDINNKSYRFDNNRFGKQTLLLRVETQDGKAHNFKVLTH